MDDFIFFFFCFFVCLLFLFVCFCCCWPVSRCYLSSLCCCCHCYVRFLFFVFFICSFSFLEGSVVFVSMWAGWGQPSAGQKINFTSFRVVYKCWVWQGSLAVIKGKINYFIYFKYFLLTYCNFSYCSCLHLCQYVSVYTYVCQCVIMCLPVSECDLIVHI